MVRVAGLPFPEVAKVVGQTFPTIVCELGHFQIMRPLRRRRYGYHLSKVNFSRRNKELYYFYVQQIVDY